MSMIRKLSTNDTLIHDELNNKIYILPNFDEEIASVEDALQVASQLISMGKGICLGSEQLDRLWHATKHISPLS